VLEYNQCSIGSRAMSDVPRIDVKFTVEEGCHEVQLLFR